MSDIVIDTRAFSRDLEQTVERLQRRSESNLGDLGEVMMDAAEQHAPVGATGKLKAGFKLKRQRTIEGYTCTLTNNTPYAGFVEFGTNDTPARPFMRPARARAQVQAPIIMRRV